MSSLPRVAFMGSDAIAVPVLKYLAVEAADKVAVAGVFSQPDRPKGRGKKLQPNPLAAAAQELGLPLLQPEKPGAAEAEWLEAQGVELVLVMAYGHILRKRLLAAPALGYVNFHASLLPKYRGASPVESAVASGEAETGVSLMRIVPKMDAGPVLDMEAVTIDPLDTGASVREKLSAATVPLLARNLDALLAGTADFKDQDEAAATYCRKLEKADGQLDFTASAAALAARINGLDPWPGCFCEVGETRIKVRQALVLDGAASSNAPGEVLAASKDGVDVATGEGVLRITELQRPGGKMHPARDFLSGFDLPAGTRLSGDEMRPLILQGPR
ncbi:methionyl-tRNA formyltransferase [Ruficoccus sp. ZRK36]|uniref:methionyl-tRNA formyltransferase n=1 Tax=Ruficoccus sp. ZRK36 TaxID=2866311 RepID=UPI001C72A1FB|nr:methionyl-tRNA formyltransferase [Ruficoccus sp. ZRK36]QYY34717.1 methionyl-tRNA formyltransferase [Ruficoccus sp. ZRK36]